MTSQIWAQEIFHSKFPFYAIFALKAVKRVRLADTYDFHYKRKIIFVYRLALLAFSYISIPDGKFNPKEHNA